MKDKVGNVLYIESITDTGFFLRDGELKNYKITIKFKGIDKILTWYCPLNSKHNFKNIKKIIVKILKIENTKKLFLIKD